MNQPVTTPVALFVYRRPEVLARTFERVRAARPTTLFLVADVPPEHDGGAADPQHRAALAVARAVDWPCEVVQFIADDHLGCSRRMRGGLDLVFAEVDRAIVVEDDILVDPSFFTWCQEMLDRYADEPNVLHVSGRNELGAWPADGHDHLVARRGSIWGWATWRRAWQGRPTLRISAPSTGDDLLDAHLHVLGLDAPAGTAIGWDIEWTLDVARVGGLAIVPPFNLVENTGFGVHATLTTAADDLRGHLPVGVAPTPTGTRRTDIAADYDHRCVLIDLMSTYRQPLVAARLGRLRRHSPDDPAVHHHLAPFDEPARSLEVLRHLHTHGASGEQLDALIQAMEQAVRWQQ